MPKQLSLALGQAGRAAALELLEQTRAGWLKGAQHIAVRIAQRDGSVCADDIHSFFGPIPEGVDPRVMGAVFRIRELVPDGYVQTKRACAHARPIRRFVLASMEEPS